MKPITDLHVLVDLQGSRPDIRVAIDLARHFSAHLTAVAHAFEPLMPVYPMVAPIPTELLVAAREEALAQARAATASFAQSAVDAAVAHAVRSFESVAGDDFNEIVGACRLTDLAAVGQNDPDGPELFRPALMDALLFDAAAPTLLVPYAGVSSFRSDRALVAWDGSASASRALRAALPLLALAKQVTVVTVVEAEKWAGGIPGADVSEHRARYDLKVELRRLDNTLHDVGATLLNIAADTGAGWLVTGAYGHHRMRELLLGGVTRTILASTPVPVLMAH